MVATRTAPVQMLTIKEVAAMLRFGRTKTKALIYEGVIPSVKIGRHRRVRDTDLVEYMQSLPAAPPEQSAGSAA